MPNEVLQAFSKPLAGTILAGLTTAPVLFETATDDAAVYRCSLQLNNVGKSARTFLFLERHHHGEVTTIIVITAGIKI